jgi:hypothetical protein
VEWIKPLLGHTVGLDTAPLIYFIEKHPQYSGMEEVISAPRSPWQNPYVERLIGSIRRDV